MDEIAVQVVSNCITIFGILLTTYSVLNIVRSMIAFIVEGLDGIKTKTKVDFSIGKMNKLED